MAKKRRKKKSKVLKKTRVIKTSSRMRVSTKSKSVSKIKIGPLLGLMYERDGEKYMHKFTSNKPTLETNIGGNQMYITGGRYLWTPIGVK